MLRMVIAATVLLAVCGCATLAHNKLRFDASQATGCPEKAVKILNFSSGVARVDACGRELTCYFRRDPGGDATQQLAGVGGFWECH